MPTPSCSTDVEKIGARLSRRPPKARLQAKRMQTIPRGRVVTGHSPALKKQAQVMFPCFQNWSGAREVGKARKRRPSPPPPASLSGGTHGEFSQPGPSRPSPAISLNPRTRGLTAREVGRYYSGSESTDSRRNQPLCRCICLSHLEAMRRTRERPQKLGAPSTDARRQTLRYRAGYSEVQRMPVPSLEAATRATLRYRGRCVRGDKKCVLDVGVLT